MEFAASLYSSTVAHIGQGAAPTLRSTHLCESEARDARHEHYIHRNADRWRQQHRPGRRDVERDQRRQRRRVTVEPSPPPLQRAATAWSGLARPAKHNPAPGRT
jgi:hypothetical protein